ncbi:hypothetical protein GUJ93_ZPchr0005g15752 [Zizania palustris]|uniref:Uncharacterized protein n=1 Tax=Zizania palustris TaxID=103762 RepID=A0A8J5SN80_ZIZPA|nr:hypothetical protein GUJ93_ZPchr0005g15752 [Zizania palustris]
MEKIRPEKELERARAEILRCKMKIRIAFQNLDLISKGKKLDGSLYLILKGGYLMKIFFVVLVTDEAQLYSTPISFLKKVFPEAAALPPAGSVQNDPYDYLPSDDSEDSAFDPDLAQDHEQHVADEPLEEPLLDRTTDNSSLSSKNLKMDQDVASPSVAAGRRRVPRVDYRKLNDEFFGEAWYESSDGEEWYGSSDDEEWSGEQIEKGPSSRKRSRKTRAANQLMSDEPAPLKAQQSSNPDALLGYLNEQYVVNHIPKRARSRRNWNLMVAPRQDSDTDTMMEEPEGCENKARNEETASGNLNNEGVKQHSPAEQDINAAGAEKDQQDA